MSSNRKALDYAISATQHLANRKYYEAILDLTEALKMDRDNTYYYCLRGKIYSLIFTNCTTHPNYWNALNPEHINSLHEKYFLPAISDFNETLKLNPLYAEAYFRRGFLNAVKGNLYEAFSDLSEAYSLDKENPEIKEALTKQIENKLDINISILTEFPYDKQIRLVLQSLDLLKVENLTHFLLRKKLITHLLMLIQPHRERMHLLFEGAIFDNKSNLYNVFPKELIHHIANEFCNITSITAVHSFFHQKNKQGENKEFPSEWHNFRPGMTPNGT